MLRMLRTCCRALRAPSVAACSLLLILSAGARAQDALERAIYAGDEAGARALIEAGADVNRRLPPFSTPPLSLAAIRGEAGIVDLLLAAGAEVDLPDYRGMTALSAAVRSCAGSAPVIEKLLAAGADIDSRSGANLTPLLVAMQEERWDIARVLIGRGADIDALNSFGEGVLNYAIYYRRNDLVNVALDERIDHGQLRRLYGERRHYHLNFGVPGASARALACRQS